MKFTEMIEKLASDEDGTISGTFPMDNVEIYFPALDQSLHVSYAESGSCVMFHVYKQDILKRYDYYQDVLRYDYSIVPRGSIVKKLQRAMPMDKALKMCINDSTLECGPQHMKSDGLWRYHFDSDTRILVDRSKNDAVIAVADLESDWIVQKDI